MAQVLPSQQQQQQHTHKRPRPGHEDSSNGLIPQSPENILGPPEIDPCEITREHILGDGSFGAVYKGRCRQKDVAVKVLFKQFDEKSLRAFRKEVAIMSKIFHPNIVLFLGACTSLPGQLMICTELMISNLEGLLLNPHTKLNLLPRMKMARDAALGILWLHSSNPVFIHRDLKTSNLLVDSNMTVKVCDFGLSQIKPRGVNLKDGQEGAKGTPLWMAPEVLLGQTFNEKADVYSFGLVLWQIVARQELFPQFDNLDTFIRAVCYNHHRPTIPPDTPPVLVELITSCWQANPDLRPNFSQIVDTLNSIIVDCAIPDEAGAAYWKLYFKEKDQVSWRDFLNTFCRVLQLTNELMPPMYDLLQHSKEKINPELELQIRCLKAIIVTVAQIQGQEEEVVTMEQFGKVLAWFGNLKHDGIAILEKIRQAMSFGWFHGDVSMPESEARLNNKSEGTFLVRFSTSEVGVFTISKVSSSGISHQRIQRVHGQYIVNKKGYSTIVSLVENESHNLNLLTACGGSRFASLFRKQQLSGYLN
jgi:serine/threonine protein kinase